MSPFDQLTAEDILNPEADNQAILLLTDLPDTSTQTETLTKRLTARERANLRAAYFFHSSAKKESSPIKEAKHQVEACFHIQSIGAWMLLESFCLEVKSPGELPFYKQLGELGLYPEQIELCETLVGKFNSEIDKNLNLQVGFAYSFLCKYETAIQKFEMLLDQANLQQDIPWQIYGLGGLAYCYDQWGKHQIAIVYCKQQLQLFRGALRLQSQKNWTEVLAKTHSILGRSYMLIRESRKAIKHLKQALTLSQQCGNTKLQWYVMGRLAFTYGATNRHNEAQKYLEEQHNFPQSTPREVGTRYLVLAMHQCFLRDFDQALLLFEDSISKSQEAQDYNVECFSILGTVLIHTLNKHYPLAIEQASRALKVAQNLDYYHHQCSAYFQLSSIHGDIDRPEECLHYAQQAIAVSEKVDLPGYQASAYSALAGAYLIREDYMKFFLTLMTSFSHMVFPFLNDRILVWIIYRKVSQHVKMKLAIANYDRNVQ